MIHRTSVCAAVQIACMAGTTQAQNGTWTRDAGTVTLSGANTYRGLTIVNNGVLQLTHERWLPEETEVSIASGAMIDLNFTGTSRISSLWIG